MRAAVFTDGSLKRHAGQFVWLSINTEKANNASFLTKFPVQVWPSLFIIDPRKEMVTIRWVGGATVPQLEKLLTDGRRSMQAPGRGLDETLARADRLYGEGKNAQAAEAYREALRTAPASWPSYSRAVESLLFALENTHDAKRCATLAREAYPKLAKTPSAANVAGTGLDCALNVAVDDPERAELVAFLTRACRELIANPGPNVSPDDLSSVYLTLAGERETARDEEGKTKVLSDWALFLEGVASRAKTPEGRSAFDSHRLSAYLELKAPERAIPMLEASERDFPDDYNPPARLAVAYKAMKRYEDALAASDRALERAYGPRKILILSNRADIYAAKGDPAAARQTVEEALRTAEAFPTGQRSEGQIASLKKKLAEIPQVEVH
jgi:tetratricopeptide (TPR) repeat protein